MANKVLITLTIFFLTTVTAFCQNRGEFSKEEMSKLEKKAKEYFNTFIKTVKSLSKPNNYACDDKCKEIKINTTLARFKPNATVQTISAKTEKISKWSLEKYLRQIVKGYAAKQTDITFDHIVIDPNSLREVKGKNGEIEYKMRLMFGQTFCSKNKKDNKESNDENVDDYEECDYADYTKKAVEIIIKKVVSAEFGESWIVLLGDIKVQSVKDLKKSKI